MNKPSCTPFRYIKTSCFFLALITLFSAARAQDTTLVYGDGNVIRAKGCMENEVKSGEWLFYYPQGSLSGVENYQGGKLHGKVIYFDVAGNKLAEENWCNGLQQDSSFYYYPNGQIEKAGIFADGQYEGSWTFFWENGQTKRLGSYVNGLPEGLWIFYSSKEVKEQEGYFSAGKED